MYDPRKLREALGLPADATDEQVLHELATDPELAAFRPSAPPERSPWVELETADVCRTALELLELWAMARMDAADTELTKITAHDRLSHLTPVDVIRVATCVAAIAVHVLTTDAERGALSERLVLEMARLMPAPERSS